MLNERREDEACRTLGSSQYCRTLGEKEHALKNRYAEMFISPGLLED